MFSFSLKFEGTRLFVKIPTSFILILDTKALISTFHHQHLVPPPSTTLIQFVDKIGIFSFSFYFPVLCEEGILIN